jgi:hypothetical protein
MRAMTIRQPRAAALLAAPGPSVQPAWRTDHRGPLLIHAATQGAGDPSPDAAGSPVYGALLGVVDLVDCVETGRPSGGPDEVGYVWVLANPRPFARPVPHPGRRAGLFDVADAAVAGALEGASAPAPPRRGSPMTPKKSLEQRQRELQVLLATPAGRDQLRELEARYAAAGGRLRPGGASVVTYILVHERERGLIGG